MTMESSNTSGVQQLSDDPQYDALVALSHATHMSNWLDDADSTNYCHPNVVAGITCHADNDHDVKEVDLTSSNLQGTLPTELGSLTRLYRLAVGSNQLYGTLPSTLGNLVALEHFEVYRNDLTGPLSLPDVSWKNLTRLKRILVHKNRLTGTISSDLCLLDKLHSLALFQNDFHGTIPDCLSSLSTLQIQDAGLTGTIPQGLCSGSVFGCDGIACSSGTFHPDGRQTDLASPCLSCPSSMCLGAISCPTLSPTTSVVPTTLAFSEAPSQTPSTLGPSNHLPPTRRPSSQPSVESPPPEASSMPTRSVSSNDFSSNAPSIFITSLAPSGVTHSYAPTPTLPSTTTNTPSNTVLRSSSTPSTPDVTGSSLSPSNEPTSPPSSLLDLAPTTPSSYKKDPSSREDATSSSSSFQDTNWALLAIAMVLSVIAMAAVIWVRRRGRQWWYDKRVSTPPLTFEPIQQGTADEEDDHVSLESDSGWNDTESSIGGQEEEEGEEEMDQDEHYWNVYFSSLTTSTIASLPSVAEEEEEEER